LKLCRSLNSTDFSNCAEVTSPSKKEEEKE